MLDYVVLVDKNDLELGIMEKQEAHLRGKLHRAFSVLLYRKTAQGLEFLLQQRSAKKYHSANLWSNTCCSHPRLKESTAQAAARRLEEELFLKECDLTFIGTLYYKAFLDHDMIEHELDHLYLGPWDGELPSPNADEVHHVAWWSDQDLIDAMKREPLSFTAWFPLIFHRAMSYFSSL